MPEYRIYFRDELGKIGARQGLLANEDAEACEAAALIYDACSDRASSYEVWDGRRLVVASAQRLPQSRLAILGEARQERIIAYEEMLRDSAWQIGRSRKLVEAIDSAQGFRSSPTKHPPKPPRVAEP